MAFSDLEILARNIGMRGGRRRGYRYQGGCLCCYEPVQVDYGEYGRLQTIREVVYQPRQLPASWRR